MTARKRKENESYTAYRLNLQAEEAAIKMHLRGRYCHISKTFTWAGDKVVYNKGVTYVRAVAQ